MPNEEKNTLKNTDILRNKSSLAVYGMDETLDDENEQIKNIIQHTIIDTKKKYGERTNQKPINYFNEINFGNAFSELMSDKKSQKDSAVKKMTNSAEFKRFMSENPQIDIGSLMAEDGSRTLQFSNYRIIHQHIPECAKALMIYKDNIMSPDDYTKLIFNVSYDKAINDDIKKIVNERLDNIEVKYDLERKADKIIEEALELGESYYAVLSLEDELNQMLSESADKGMLTEDLIRTFDKESVDLPVLSENFNLSAESLSALNEALELPDGTALNENQARELCARFINENVVIGSSREMLLERIAADKDVDKYGDTNKKRPVGRPRKNEPTKPLYVNGSAVRHLIPEKVVSV